MGKMKSGHSFPSKKGFTGSAGMKTVGPYTRAPAKPKAPAAAGGGAPQKPMMGPIMQPTPSPLGQLAAKMAKGGKAKC